MRGATHGGAQLEEGFSSYESLLVVVLDLDVDDVHWPVQFSASIEKIC